MNDSVRLEHAYITVRDLDRSLVFYRALLPGWEIRWEGKSGSGRWIHLGPPDEPQPSYLSLAESPGAATPDEAYSSHRIQHIGFTHPDVEALIARLGAVGVAPTDRAEDDRWRRAYFEDPDGNEVEMVQRLG